MFIILCIIEGQIVVMGWKWVCICVLKFFFGKGVVLQCWLCICIGSWWFIFSFICLSMIGWRKSFMLGSFIWILFFVRGSEYYCWKLLLFIKYFFGSSKNFGNQVCLFWKLMCYCCMKWFCKVVGYLIFVYLSMNCSRGWVIKSGCLIWCSSGLSFVCVKW